MMKFILLMISFNILTFFLNKKMFILIISNLMILMMILMNLNFLHFYWIKINYFWGMDYLSLNLIILSVWILYLSIFSNKNFIENNFKMNYLNLMFILLNILILCFCSMNMMIFYIMFEFSLIPIVLLIMGWGYQIDRIQASLYMLFYTLFASLPLLVMLMYMYMKFNSLMFNILNYINKFYDMNLLMYFMLILGFLVKMPLYMTHLWLPKAHVEAPISGSMILAGIMLKLGSYGLYRFMNMYKYMFMNFNMFLIIFSLLGGMISSIICLNQNDMKIIVAYSSIVHMSILMSGMMTLMYMGMISSLFMMISHGLCSCGMFFLLNLFYERTKSRNLLINKGLINLMPSMSLWWFLIFSSNFSAPFSLNLFSEILLFNSLINWSIYLIMLIILISFFSTCYSIYLYAFSQYGKMNFLFKNFNFNNCLDYLIIMMLWIPLNLLFLNLNLMF